MSILTSIALVLLGVVISFGIFFLVYKFWYARKKKREEQNYPRELDELLNRVERRYSELNKDGRKVICPYSILWENYERKRDGQTDIADGAIYKPVEDRELPERIGGQQDIQDGTTGSIEQHQDSIREIKPNNSRNFFSRFRKQK